MENSNPATTAEREALAQAFLEFLPADEVLSRSAGT